MIFNANFARNALTEMRGGGYHWINPAANRLETRSQVM